MKRKHVLGIVVFFFIYIVASLGGEHETRSSFSFAPTGTKAVHDALLELDLPVVWWRKPFPLLAQELPKGSTLLVVTPSEPLEKIRELLDWVKSGNRLLVFGAGGAGLQSEPLDEF